MKRIVSALVLLALFLGLTVGAVVVSVNRVSSIAQAENREKTALVQQRLGETLDLLEGLSRDGYIRDLSIPFEEKAEFLTDKNQSEGLGYMMLRILDGEINIYREGIGAASNLGSREYLQTLYATGVSQVTDAFLAGADGQTINYTVAVAIQEDGQVVAALMAAIYGTELDALLQSEGAENVLVGSQLQYMSGAQEDQFGLAVAQVLESELQTSRPVENVLLDFYEKESGDFWGFGDGAQYFTYAPVARSGWVVLTEVSVLPLVWHILAVYLGAVAVLAVAGVLLLRRKGTTAPVQ